MNIIAWRDKMPRDIPTYEEVFQSFEPVFRIIDLMDNTYKMYRGNFLMRYYQNRGISLRFIYTKDMLNWLCFLGWSDGNIDVNEVIFINELLNLNLTQLDILNIVNDLDPKSLSVLPLSFAIFMEHFEVSDTENKDKIINALFNSYAIAGTYFVACDGDIDRNELIGLDAYLKTLDMNIRTFNLDSLHDYMLDNI